VVISSTEILTAEHVIRGATSVTASVPGVGNVFATVRGWDKGRDLALLTFTSGNFNPAEVFLPADGMLLEGEWDWHGARWDSIVAVGYVPSISETVALSTFERVALNWLWMSTANPENLSISMLSFDAGVAPGMSGGAVFDVHGHLAGIIHSQKAFGFDHRAISWEEINEVLTELRAGATNP